MAEFIKMPTLGFDMEEGAMGTWLKQVGDPVSKGDVLAEIESDKVTQELQARAEGVLLTILAETGDLVPVGANLGIIGAEGEDIAAMLAEAGASTTAPVATAAVVEEATSAQAAPVAAAATVPVSNAVSEEFPGGVKATPVARRVAAEHGVNLAQVGGSGPDGRIRKSDVESFLTSPQVAVPAVSAPVPAVSIPAIAGDDMEEVPLTRMRQAIARRMVESKTTVPHFYVTNEIDMAPAFALRKQINDSLEPEEKVTVNDLIVKAAGLALRKFPNINASFAGDKIIKHKRINVGTAVSVEGGLLTVVQKDTDSASISKIARDHKGMIARARDGKVQPSDVEGSTFTVSNLGGFDVDNFIAIVSPPNAAILAVGSARQVPVVVDGELAIGTRMKLTISADHRVTDGVEAAQFLQAVKETLEDPLKLLL